MTSKEIYEQLKELWDSFETNNKRFQDKGVKAAGVRARKAINEIKKLASKYRTACLNESKAKQ
jgi:hypothetical protein